MTCKTETIGVQFDLQLELRLDEYGWVTLVNMQDAVDAFREAMTGAARQLSPDVHIANEVYAFPIRWTPNRYE